MLFKSLFKIHHFFVINSKSTIFIDIFFVVTIILVILILIDHKCSDITGLLDIFLSSLNQKYIILFPLRSNFELFHSFLFIILFVFILNQISGSVCFLLLLLVLILLFNFLKVFFVFIDGLLIFFSSPIFLMDSPL